MKLFIAFLVLCMAIHAADAPPPSSLPVVLSARPITIGAYELMTLPTRAEMAKFYHTAERHGLDFVKSFHDLPESDLQAWSKFFAVSMDFRNYDREAQVYGYHLFTSWLYYVSFYGIDKYAKLLDAQPADLRQRVRDFIYADAALAPMEYRKALEEELRVKCPSLFPKDYVFGKGDEIFEPSPSTSPKGR